MAKNSPLPIEDAQFEEKVLKAQGTVVVDFWAPWCGPCVQMAPALEAFAEANAGAIRVYKLDVDENPKTAERFEVRSIPTIVFFMNGEIRYISRGAMSGTSLQNKLNELHSPSQAR